MLAILVAIGFFTLAFVLIETFQRVLSLSTELTRKLAHIIGAGGAALLPIWLPWKSIFIIAVFFVLVMALSKFLHGFHSIHDVKRRTYGEVFMPVSVAILAAISPDVTTYSCALLVLAFADPAAQYVGQRFGRRRSWLPGSKTVEGSLGFLLVAALIIGLMLVFGSSDGASTIAFRTLITAVVATLAEYIGSAGFDNVTIPIAVAVCLIVL